LDWIETGINWTSSLAKNALNKLVDEGVEKVLAGKINLHGFDTEGENLFKAYKALPVISGLANSVVYANDVLRRSNLTWSEKAARVSLKVADEAALTAFEIGALPLIPISGGASVLTTLAISTALDESLEWRLRQLEKVGAPVDQFLYDLFVPKTAYADGLVNYIGRPTKKNH